MLFRSRFRACVAYSVVNNTGIFHHHDHEYFYPDFHRTTPPTSVCPSQHPSLLSNGDTNATMLSAHKATPSSPPTALPSNPPPPHISEKCVGGHVGTFHQAGRTNPPHRYIGLSATAPLHQFLRIPLPSLCHPSNVTSGAPPSSAVHTTTNPILTPS